MGNTKGKMTIKADETENAEGKTCPTVEINDAVEGGAPSNPEVQPSSENTQECGATNGHATATGEKVLSEEAACKADAIEECPAPAEETATTTTTTNKNDECGSKCKIKDSKPILWLKQVKKRVSFSKKKKTPVEKKTDAAADANECAGESEKAADASASPEGDVTNVPSNPTEERKLVEGPSSDADITSNVPHIAIEEARQETANVESTQ